MARGYNKHTIIGNLGADPDIRYGKNNSIIARISVATTELVSVQWEHKEETEWHTVVLFNKRAETARDYLRKGSEIFVEGRSKTNRWTDSSGQKRSHKEILATDMRLLGSSNNLPQRSQSHEAQPHRQQNPEQTSSQSGLSPHEFDSSAANI